MGLILISVVGTGCKVFFNFYVSIVLHKYFSLNKQYFSLSNNSTFSISAQFNVNSGFCLTDKNSTQGGWTTFLK